MTFEGIVVILMGIVIIGVAISLLRHLWPLALIVLIGFLAWNGLSHF